MKNQKYDAMYVTGIIATLLCSGVFFGVNFSGEEDLMGQGFIVIYLITLLYWITLLFRAIFFRKSFNSGIFYPAIILSFISCFSLNSILPVFDKSTEWYGTVIVFLSVAFIIIPLFDNLPKTIQFASAFILGIGSIVLLYLSIYLAPLYIFGLMVFLVLGISLLCFTPLVMLVTLLLWKYKLKQRNNKQLKRGFLTGFCFAILVIIAYTSAWHYNVNKINHAIFSKPEAQQTQESSLPQWINVARHIPPNMFTEKILKVDLAYPIPDWSWNNLFDGPSRNFSEEKIHDPLVVIASITGKKIYLTKDEKINILESIYNNRHQTVERFWSDEGIETTNIETTAEIWPQYRIAYTEQIIRLRNNRSYWSRGEAIYTFHLPEGSVVSSLSLWIEGEERKGILTTKEKADEAYRTIVGVESRDPSLVHWQEGSTVIVRVFPVFCKEERQFKIGVTTPLQISKNKIKYEPLYFDGTEFSKAQEKLNICFMQEPEGIDYPAFLKKGKSGNYQYRGRYKNNWQMTMKQSFISSEDFHFDGNKYSIKKLEHLVNPVNIQDIYLDINNSWTEEEFNAVYKASSGKKLWVNKNSGMVLLTGKNKESVYKELKKLQFSIFPIHKIKSGEGSLIVSKSALASPNIKELENTSFLKELKRQIKPSEKTFFFNMGNNLSPFLQTMLEYRVLEYQQGDIKYLQEILQTNKFPVFMPENDNSIAIYQSGISINRENCSQQEKGGNAPDHLMRLFAYNHILRQYTQSWKGDTLISNELIREAQEANIVTPVSSLVVLETQADYDRFDIREAENSIGNASTKTQNTPAGELNIWILLGIFIVYSGYKRLKRLS